MQGIVLFLFIKKEEFVRPLFLKQFKVALSPLNALLYLFRETDLQLYFQIPTRFFFARF